VARRVSAKATKGVRLPEKGTLRVALSLYGSCPIRDWQISQKWNENDNIDAFTMFFGVLATHCVAASA
jgi:hypothetical protein